MASFELANPRNSGAYDGASALAVMPDGRLLVGGFSANYYYDYPDPTRLSHLLWLNADGSMDRNVALDHATNVCHGIKGLLARTDGSLLVGDDTGIYAFLNDSVLQTFGVQGVAMNADFRIGNSGTHCFGLRSFAADPNGELLTVSEVELPDGQLGFELRRLNENGTETAGSVRVPPVPLASLVRNDQRFVDSAVSIYAPSQMARPIQSGADGRLYLLFGFFWDEGASDEGIGDGWAIARFAADGTLDTGWGDSGVVVLEKGGVGYWDSVPTLLEPLPDGRIVALTPNGVLTRLLGGQREGHGAINVASGLDVVEAARQIRIEVTRTGGSAGAVSVEYIATGITDLGSQRGERTSRRRTTAAWIGRMVIPRRGKLWFIFSRTRSKKATSISTLKSVHRWGRRTPEHQSARADQRRRRYGDTASAAATTGRSLRRRRCSRRSHADPLVFTDGA